MRIGYIYLAYMEAIILQERSMKKTQHFIWATEIIDKVEHFSNCKRSSEPFISLSRNGKGMVVVSLDTLLMYDSVYPPYESLGSDDYDKRYQENLDSIPNIETKLAAFYLSYCETFELPDEKFLVSGSDGTFGLLVYEEHAEFVAQGLYYYLVKCRDDFRSKAMGNKVSAAVRIESQ